MATDSKSRDPGNRPPQSEQAWKVWLNRLRGWSLQFLAHSQVVALYYWDSRAAIGWYIQDRFPDFQMGAGDGKDIRLDLENDLHASQSNEKPLVVSLPNCCVICGELTGNKSTIEAKKVADLGRPVLAPTISLATASLVGLIFASPTLFVFGTLSGFYIGYRLRSELPVKLRLKRCKKHAGRKKIPRVRIYQDDLIVRVGHRKVRNAFLEPKSSIPGGAFVPTAADMSRTSLPLDQSTEDQGPISLAESDDDSTPILHASSELLPELPVVEQKIPAGSDETQQPDDKLYTFDSPVTDRLSADPLPAETTQPTGEDGANEIETGEPIGLVDSDGTTGDQSRVCANCGTKLLPAESKCPKCNQYRSTATSDVRKVIAANLVRDYQRTTEVRGAMGKLKKLKPAPLSAIFFSAFSAEVVADVAVFMMKIVLMAFLFLAALIIFVLIMGASLVIKPLIIVLLPLGIFGLFIALRFFSFVVGSYFATCRRAATGSIGTEDDRGGLVDLGLAFFVYVESVVPIMAWFHMLEKWFPEIDTVAELLPTLSNWNHHPIPALTIPVMIFFALIFLIGMTVAAIEGVVNPIRLYLWFYHCFFDFMCVLLLLIPVFILSAGIHYGIGYTTGWVLKQYPDILLVLVPFFTVPIYLFFNYFPVFVLFNALGIMARRNEHKLHWYAKMQD